MACEPGSYVAGVPVRISEAYRPPRKVTLPASCPYLVDADLLTEEYDIRIETAAISWIQEYQQQKEENKQKRQEKIEAYRKRKAEQKAKLEEDMYIKAQKEEERMKKEKLEEEERRKQELLEEERLEIEKERAELERLGREMIERERFELDRVEKERIEKEKAEQLRIERETAEQLRMELVNMARLTKDVREKAIFSEDISALPHLQEQTEDKISDDSEIYGNDNENSSSVEPAEQDLTVHEDNETAASVVDKSARSLSKQSSSDTTSSDDAADAAAAIPPTTVSTAIVSNVTDVKHQPVISNEKHSSVPSSHYLPCTDTSLSTKSWSDNTASDVLKPTLINSNYNRNGVKCAYAAASINYADFEGDKNDPFDSAALKSINDMEELAQVLQSTQPVLPHQFQGSNYVTHSSNPLLGISSGVAAGTTSVQNVTGGMGVIPGVGVSSNYNPMYAAGYFPLFGNAHNQRLPYNNSIRGICSSYSTDSSMGKSNPVSNSLNSSPTQRIGPYPPPNVSTAHGVYSNVFYPPSWNSSAGTSSTASPEPIGRVITSVGDPYRMYNNSGPGNVSINSTNNSTAVTGVAANIRQSMAVHGHQHALSSSTHHSAAEGTSRLSQPLPPDAVALPEAPCQRPDLEDFYTRYYGGVQSRGVTSYSHQTSGGGGGGCVRENEVIGRGLQKTSYALRASRSVPDLTACEDHEVFTISENVSAASNLHTSNQSNSGISSSQRPSSTGPALARQCVDQHYTSTGNRNNVNTYNGFGLGNNFAGPGVYPSVSNSPASPPINTLSFMGGVGGSSQTSNSLRHQQQYSSNINFSGRSLNYHQKTSPNGYQNPHSAVTRTSSDSNADRDPCRGNIAVGSPPAVGSIHNSALNICHKSDYYNTSSIRNDINSSFDNVIGSGRTTPCKKVPNVSTSTTTGGSNFLTLSDPFEELESEAQNIVTSVSEMGFPRDRVARAVMRLGTQHKKLIEVLLELQRFEESGEDAARAEVAFYAHLGDTEKTREHLASARQLVSLGFDEPRVTALLLKYDNDRDKTLEELIA